VEDNNSLRNPVGNGLVEPNPSLTDQALIKVSKVWEQMQQRVPMDQLENWVESLEAAAGMEGTVTVQQCDVEAPASVKRLSLHFKNAKTSHPSVSGTQAVNQLDLVLIEPISLNLVKSISGAPQPSGPPIKYAVKPNATIEVPSRINIDLGHLGEKRKMEDVSPTLPSKKAREEKSSPSPLKFNRVATGHNCTSKGHKSISMKSLAREKSDKLRVGRSSDQVESSLQLLHIPGTDSTFLLQSIWPRRRALSCPFLLHETSFLELLGGW
jgi:hypothetical protein